MSRDFSPSASTYLNAADNTKCNVTGTLVTVSAWVQLDRNNVANMYVAKAGATAGSCQWQLYTDTNGKINAVIGDASGVDGLVGAATVTTGVWHHLALTKNGTGTNSLLDFLDGTQDGAFTSTRSMVTTVTLVIGNRASNDVPSDCRIAEVAVWDVALTAAEIAALAKGANPLGFRRDHVRGYWPLYGVGYPEPDLSGNNGPLSQTGTVPAGAAGPPVQPLSSVMG